MINEKQTDRSELNPPMINTTFGKSTLVITELFFKTDKALKSNTYLTN